MAAKTILRVLHVEAGYDQLVAFPSWSFPTTMFFILSFSNPHSPRRCNKSVDILPTSFHSSLPQDPCNRDPA